MRKNTDSEKERSKEIQAASKYDQGMTIPTMARVTRVCKCSGYDHDDMIRSHELDDSHLRRMTASGDSAGMSTDQSDQFGDLTTDNLELQELHRSLRLSFYDIVKRARRPKKYCPWNDWECESAPVPQCCLERRNERCDCRSQHLQGPIQRLRSLCCANTPPTTATSLGNQRLHRLLHLELPLPAAHLPVTDLEPPQDRPDKHLPAQAYRKTKHGSRKTASGWTSLGRRR